MAESRPAAVTFPVSVWHGGFAQRERALPEEIPVAMTYDSATFAVMMASPQDLEDFARGFSLSEGIISDLSEITALDVINLPLGLECRMSLAPMKRDALAARRRYIAGPVGCGLCGMESLTEAVRSLKPVQSDLLISPETIMSVMERMGTAQELSQETRAVHAAGFYQPESDRLIVREDVGRHNALDKVIGASAAQNLPGQTGIILLTSRVSIELIQKTAALGAGIIVAVSVPSARAVRDAEAAGITLVAVARADGFEVFTNPERIKA